MGHHNEVLQVYPTLIVPVGLYLNTQNICHFILGEYKSPANFLQGFHSTPNHQFNWIKQIFKWSITQTKSKSSWRLKGGSLQHHFHMELFYCYTYLFKFSPKYPYDHDIISRSVWWRNKTGGKSAAMPHTLLLVLCHSSLRTSKTRHLPAYFSHHKHVCPRK
jgi:hypothetical protein